jgi:hypothetical protein
MVRDSRRPVRRTAQDEFYMGGRVPLGVTAHDNPIGPLQFDRLEVVPAARKAHLSNLGSMEGQPNIAGAFDADQWLGRISRSPFVVMRLEQILPDTLNQEIAPERA